MNERRYLSLKEAAQQMGVSYWTMYRLVTQGEIAHTRVKNTIRISVAELEAWAARGGSRSS